MIVGIVSSVDRGRRGAGGNFFGSWGGWRWDVCCDVLFVRRLMGQAVDVVEIRCRGCM